ncbi:MAG: hypothetical protein ABI612_11265 [Betaproteobacteria bacterium]
MVLFNSKHEAFALGLAEGKTQERAYVDAGYSPNGARGSANHLLKQQDSISQRVKQILAEREKLRSKAVVAAEKAVSLTLVSHLEKLAELRDNAVAIGDYNAAISAEHKRGLASGFYVVRRESGRVGEFAGLSDDELRAKLAAYRAIIKAKGCS